MKDEIKDIRENIKDIRENHLHHIESDIREISTNQKWLMKFFWLIAGSSIGALITGFINLILQVK